MFNQVRFSGPGHGDRQVRGSGANSPVALRCPLSLGPSSRPFPLLLQPSLPTSVLFLGIWPPACPKLPSSVTSLKSLAPVLLPRLSSSPVWSRATLPTPEFALQSSLSRACFGFFPAHASPEGSLIHQVCEVLASGLPGPSSVSWQVHASCSSLCTRKVSCS